MVALVLNDFFRLLCYMVKLKQIKVKKLLCVFLCLLLCFISRVEAVDISMDFEKCEVPSFSVVRSLKIPIAIAVVDNLLTAIIDSFFNIFKLNN